MKFALFYEIPVPRPWGDDSELVAYQNTLEQAIAGDRFGWHAFWTVEHHFLQEYSHCSNPEVLYGAIASRTERIRLGYGVRLMPKPYNHPVRTAESVAVLDLLSNGRVDLGTGRSATRAELEGFGIDPAESRRMWQEAIEHVVGCWTNEEYAFEGEFWQMPRRRVQPKPLQKPHPPLWGATTSDEGHAQVGDLGLGLCSFAVGLPPSEVKRKIDIYRDAVTRCSDPIGAFVHNRAATFTMAMCNPDREQAISEARESFEWYPKTGARQIATLTDWMTERNEELGSYSYAADMKKRDDEGTLDLLSLEYLMDANACVLGTPAECLEACRQYEEAGVDLLLCLVNPYKVSHESVMQTIELMGTEVIPAFTD
jgi:alkanesulfonate monooxygenase SsuD/methylene tetrahydromethanopterin reductase-like flavin-dependent oxidoreductase (luciferase family)